MRILVIFSFLLPALTWGQANNECDETKSAEFVRIYYANGMFNKSYNAIESQIRLKQVVGKFPGIGIREESYGMSAIDGISYNKSEFPLIQFLELVDNRLNSTKKFWYWIKNVDEAPPWFQERYKMELRLLTEASVTNDSDLADHIKNYTSDLRSGKKVVIVSHSQGNFYANKAKRYFRSFKSGIYKDSIGIVAIASPSNANSSEATFFTSNSNDLVLNFVRAIFPYTLPGNVTYDITPTNHEFVKAYLFPPFMQSRIRNHVFQLAGSLKQPPVDFECQDPADVPIAVKTLPATYITPSSARLNGDVLNGKLIDTYFVTRSGNTAPNCLDFANNYDGKGPWNKGDSFYGTNFNVVSGIIYTYRACGKREDGTVVQGNTVTFVPTFT